MHEDVEAGAIQHQPWDDFGEFFGIEFHLVHRLRMRTYRRVTPSAHLDFEATLDRLADTRGGVARRVVVVDVRVIATYDRGIDRVCHRGHSSVHIRSSAMTGI